jgi:lipoprotein NlpD
LIVKTGYVVRRGQQLAEMGNKNNSRVSVLFESRHDGRPVDPMAYRPHTGAVSVSRTDFF